MDYNIILNALRESIDYIKKLDDIRGKLDENLEPINTFENVSFKNDFQDADMFLNNIYLPLKIFEIGFNEFMGSENTSETEKKCLLAKILEITKTCNCIDWRFCTYDIFTYNYFDEETGFDVDWRKIDGESDWCYPDLEAYKNAFPDERELNIYYKYSYYIISIAKIISEAVNNYLIIDSNPKKIKVNIKEKEENINDPHKDKYNDIFKLLNDSITYASPEKIGKIIQYKIKKTYDINTSINPTYNKSFFCLSSKVIINAAKIGMCFELNNNEIRHFIRLLEENNTKKQITGRIPKVDKLNTTNDLERILITIRNEYLHEIDPNVFPII